MKINRASKCFWAVKHLNAFLPLLVASFMNSPLLAADTSWPEIHTENKPGVRWWWMGSAVNKKDLTWNLEQLSNVGIGSVEITPIYGVQGNDANEIDYLSPKWMQMYNYTQAEAKRLHILVDMNGATGWPFGGPQIDVAHAATREFIQRYTLKALPGGRAKKQKIIILPEDVKQRKVSSLSSLLFVGSDGAREQIPLTNYHDSILTYGAAQDGEIFALFNGKTMQQVKRAAPGANGLVMNHLSVEALDVFLKPYDEAFKQSGAPWPNAFFNDSYEVYGADWSENLLQEFKARRGYDLADYLPEFIGVGEPAVCARVVCDYRETISDMLLHNFTIPWTQWAHDRGSLTRNQAHGSPGNLLDLYGAIDIPECESFGFNAFDIPGLRVDDRYKKSDSNPVTLKFASSAAHVMGKTFISCESMTWLTEHFRTSLSQIKPELDQLFLNGINRVYYHGSPYTPQDAPWPGWLFYASILVNPNNTIFRDMNGLNEYATRVQSFLQYGKPDNEVLVYLPIYDIWQNYRKNNFVAFDIHKLKEKLPDFQKVIFDIRDLGYDLDFVSDAQLMSSRVEGKSVITQGGKYKLIIIPNCSVMPLETMQKLLQMTKDGATVAFLNRLPDDVPGLLQAELRKQNLHKAVDEYQLFPRLSSYSGKPFQKGWVMYGSSLQDMLENVPAKCKCESITSELGAGFIRRSFEGGYVYFVAQNKNKTIDQWVTLGANAQSAIIFNPLNGEKGQAKVRQINGRTQIYLQIFPGQSLLLKTFTEENVSEPFYPVFESDKIDFKQMTQPTIGQMESAPKEKAHTLFLKGNWTFRFTNGMPAIPGVFSMVGGPVSWTTLKADSATVYAGTGRYSLTFKMPKDRADDWMLDFGTISESARIIINGQPAGMSWSLPFKIKVGKYLKLGKINTIDIDVTNLPANRIADYDRRNVKWRIFKEINFVDVLYKNTTYGNWPVMPSGLTQTPRLVPLYLKAN
jgi:hypothetical protein